MPKFTPKIFVDVAVHARRCKVATYYDNSRVALYWTVGWMQPCECDGLIMELHATIAVIVQLQTDFNIHKSLLMFRCNALQ